MTHTFKGMTKNTGTIKRSLKDKNFTIIGNNIILTKLLTPEEKGVLIYLLALPDDWVIYKSLLHKQMDIKKGAMERVFSSLVRKGWITSRKTQYEDGPLKGRFSGWEHIVYDECQLKDDSVDTERVKKSTTSEINEVVENAPIQRTNRIQRTNKKTKEGRKEREACGPLSFFSNLSGFSEVETLFIEKVYTTLSLDRHNTRIWNYILKVIETGNNSDSLKAWYERIDFYILCKKHSNQPIHNNHDSFINAIQSRDWIAYWALLKSGSKHSEAKEGISSLPDTGSHKGYKELVAARSSNKQ